MYVLARREQESIRMLEGRVRIKVLSVTGKIVRLGFDAPSDVDIEREEVFLVAQGQDNAAKE